MVIVAGFGIWYMINYNNINENSLNSEIKEESQEAENIDNDLIIFNHQHIDFEDFESDNMVVYITGAVNNPGVYSVKPKSRIVDVVEMAGGTTNDAYLDFVNLAAYVVDAQHIFIPKISDMVDKNQKTEENSNGTTNDLININTADKETLKSLPGIGDTIAGKIIKYRDENGGFKTIEEIKKVSRIGERTYEDIKDLITVG